MNDNGAGVPASEFTDRLQTLKQLGCNVLVTGKVREAVSQRMARKLLGGAGTPRTRVLAVTDYDREDAVDLLPGGVAPSDESVVVADYGRTRSASTASAGGTTPGPQQADLDDLRATLCDAITTAKIARSGFDPAQLRLSVFTLASLVNRHDSAAIDQFVSALTDHVRGVRGMAHFHLPVADDSIPVRRLAPLFDARVELREKRGRPEQRWHFPERDDVTAWYGLSVDH